VITTVAAVVIALVATFVQAGLDGLSSGDPGSGVLDVTGL
jgi:hypothetical protein